MNIKCWQATKPRQPQRKEEMSASEGKEGRRIHFLQLWHIQLQMRGAECGWHFAFEFEPTSKKREKRGNK